MLRTVRRAHRTVSGRRVTAIRHPIAVSEAKHISQVARRTVLSTNALAVLGPILEETVGWERAQIRQFFESYGILIQEWDSVRTDWLTLRPAVKEAAQAVTASA